MCTFSNHKRWFWLWTKVYFFILYKNALHFTKIVVIQIQLGWEYLNAYKNRVNKSILRLYCCSLLTLFGGVRPRNMITIIEGAICWLRGDAVGNPIVNLIFPFALCTYISHGTWTSLHRHALLLTYQHSSSHSVIFSIEIPIILLQLPTIYLRRCLTLNKCTLVFVHISMCKNIVRWKVFELFPPP